MKQTNTFLGGGTKEVQRKKRITFLVICVTLAVLVALLITFIIASVVSKAPEEDPENTDTPVINIGETKSEALSEDTLHTGNLLILNATNRYKGTPNVETLQDAESRPKKEDGETNCYTVSGRGSVPYSATPETIKAFNDMAKAFYTKTKDDNLIISNAYNSNAEDTQNAIFSAGTAVALEYFHEGNTSDRRELAKEGNYSWIYNNAIKYGFINVIIDGKASNIFRYVGVEHANAIKTNGNTLEKYVEHLKNNTSAEKPLSVKSGTASYAVYYLPANGELVFPATYSYTVSGDNRAGYIVTVKLVPSISEF